MTIQNLDTLKNHTFQFQWGVTGAGNNIKKDQVESLISNQLLKIHQEFSGANLVKAISKYFYFPSSDPDDMNTNCCDIFPDQIRAVAELEYSLVKDIDDFNIELKNIRFSKDLSVNVELYFYLKDDAYIIRQSKDNVRVLNLGNNDCETLE